MTLEVSEIWLYPIKSCGGIRVPEASLDRRGIERDRRYMLVDEDGLFVTQREAHELARVRVSPAGDHFRVSAGERGFDLETTLARGERIPVSVWESNVEARVHEVGSRWFSDFLGRSILLVYLPDEVERRVAEAYAVGDEFVAFQDAFSLLLISEASLAELNARVDRPLEMRRFRPNLVLRGGKAFVEDRLERFRIGDVAMRSTKRCSRCVVTTLDRETGEAGLEPLKTLAKYRRDEDGKVYFGMNVQHGAPGTIRVGDPLIAI